MSSPRSPAVAPVPSSRPWSNENIFGHVAHRACVDLPAFGALKSLISHRGLQAMRRKHSLKLNRRSYKKHLKTVPFPLRPIATTKRMGFGSRSRKGNRRVPPPLSSLPLPMMEYFPSKGDLAPLRHSFPPPERMEELKPPLLVSPSLPEPLVLDPDISLKDRWESLVSPEGKVDKFAVGLAT